MAGNLMEASAQWASRPSDERFDSLEALLQVTTYQREHSRENELHLNKIAAVAIGESGLVLTTGKAEALPTNWAFAQLCRTLDYPSAAVQQKLSNKLAADVINYRLTKSSPDTMINVLSMVNGSVTLRSLTSTKYARVWNNDLIKELLKLKEFGWRVPPARPAFENQPGTRVATADDVLDVEASGGLSVKVGDLIAPAGLYCGDRDLFVFLINEKNRINDGSPNGLSRGFFLVNSEVGASAVKIKMFLYRGVCGNHIVWDAQDILEFNYKHVGDVNNRTFGVLGKQLNQYVDSSANAIEDRIKWLKAKEIAPTKELVVDEVYNIGIPILAKYRIADAYDEAERHYDVDGSPRSYWGLAQGITRISQLEANADSRHLLDVAASKLLKV